jgi:predicted ATPase/DNA-binding CsgD family transcriptional regulator
VTLLSEMLAAAPGISLLITSRERLNLREEWVLDVGGLPYPASESDARMQAYDAVRLFVQHAQRVKTGFALNEANKSAVIRICRMVGGMPLGIELAAAWVRVLSCEAIAEEISRSLDILETSARNVKPRHRSMRAAFEPTWNHLSEAERAVFMKLAVFRGGFTREAAEHVAGASLRILSALVDKSLLQVDTNGRYDLHELLRQYGEEQLRSAKAYEAARAAHSTYYATWLRQQWGPLRTAEQVHVLDEIEAEFENVRTAWETMIERRDAAGLSMAVYPIWYYCDLRERYHEAITLFQQAERALRPLDGEANRAVGQLLIASGWFLVAPEKLEQGRKSSAEGAEILQRVGTVEDNVLAFVSLCLVNSQIGDVLAVKECAESAVQIARSAHDPWLLAVAQFWMSGLLRLTGQPEAAKRMACECLELAEACGDLWLRAMISGFGLGAIARGVGDFAEAKQRYEYGLQLLEQIGHAGLAGAFHSELGYTYTWMQDFSAAAYHYQQSLKILFHHGDYIPHMMDTLLRLARTYILQRNYQRAVALLTLIQQNPESLLPQRADAGRLLAHMGGRTLSQNTADLPDTNLQEFLKVLITERDQFVALDAPHDDHRLTEREREILRLIADGLNSREVAEQLVLSVGTVRWYLKQIYSKLDAHSRSEAIAHARELGLLD